LAWYVEGVVSVTGLLREVSAGRVIVAIDPGKVVNRVWVTDRAGMPGEPLSLPSRGLESIGSRRRSLAADVELDGMRQMDEHGDDGGCRDGAGLHAWQRRCSRSRRRVDSGGRG